MSWLSDLLGAPRRRVFGWWAFDDATATLVRDDGVRLRFVGPVADDAALDVRYTGNRRWLRFDLFLGRAAHPLLVERRDVRDPVLPGAGRRLVWRLDHVRSARLRGGSPPDRVEWRAIDRLAVDGLYCWPADTAAGVRPAEVAVSGGWRGGAWTPHLYRAFSGPGIGVRSEMGRFPDPPLVPRPPWSFVRPERPDSAEEARTRVEALRSAPPQEVGALVPALARGVPHLRSGERWLVPLFVRDADPTTPRWLYADAAIVTDRLRIAPSPARAEHASVWRLSLDYRDCVVGTVDRSTGAYLDFARASGGYAERTPRRDGLLVEVGTFPSWALAHFREIAEDAVWAWEDATMILPDAAGVGRELRLDRPAQAELWPATQFGGSTRATSLVAAPALRDAEGRVTRLAWMFDDGDGYAPPVRQARVGHLDFDGAAPSVVDRRSGRSLTLERTLAGSADAAVEQLGLFRYRDAEGDCALVVRRLARTESDAGAAWVLDHDASAERWRAHGGATGAPPERRWLRVTAFALDALLAWPDTVGFGPSPDTVVSAGGWWAGRWSPALRRRIGTRLFTDRTWRLLQVPGRPAPRDPLLAVADPVDPPPTAVWRPAVEPPPDRDAPHGPTSPPLALDPPDAVTVDAVDLAAFATERLDGRHHWLRDDGGALLYVCGTHTTFGREMEEIEQPLFEYCDADVRVRLRLAGASRSARELSLAEVHWPRVVRSSPFFEADGTFPAALFRPFSDQPGRWAPQPRLWHRLADALDAWVDPTRPDPRRPVVTSGLYVGGAFDPGGERRVWFEPGRP